MAGDTPANEDIARARSSTTMAIALWFGAAFMVGLAGWVNQPNVPPLVLLGFIVVPIAGFLTVYATSPAFRAFADSIRLSVLVGAHMWRFVGLFFIAGAIRGTLPKGFGWPAGVGDVIAALGALLLLPKIRNGTASRRLLLAWNTYGLADLLLALTTGLLYSNSALGVLAPGTVTTARLTTFPESLIPTFFVPLFILFHLLTFRKLEEPTARQASDGSSVERSLPYSQVNSHLP